MITPPHNAEAEAAALACVLIATDPPADQLFSQLDERHFYTEQHKTIFRALTQIEGDFEPLNTVKLYERLKASGELDNAGGRECVSKLPDATHSAAHFPAWLDILQDQAARRAMLADADDLRKRALNPTVAVEAKRKSRLPLIEYGAAFVAEKMPERPQLIHGILHKGCKLALGGNSKAFKTHILLDMALSVSHGVPWLCLETTRSRVCYVNLEIHRDFFQKRTLAVAQAKQIVVTDWFSTWNLRGHAASYDEILPQLSDELKKSELGLLILDPIYKLYGHADENSARDISLLLNHFERLAQQTGAAIAFGSHFSKGNQASKEAQDRISGSGVFARDPDAILTFTRHEMDGAFVVDFSLRNCPAIEPFCVKWEYPLMRRDGELDPEKLKQAKGGRAKAHDPDKLCAAIADSTAETPISVSAWAKAAGIPRQTLTDYLPGLRAKGWLKTAGEGSSARQYLTELGKEAAKRGAS